MLYLGIDQHKRQLTVNLRGEDGSVVLKRQVSTKWDKVREFFADLSEKSSAEGGSAGPRVAGRFGLVTALKRNLQHPAGIGCGVLPGHGQ